MTEKAERGLALQELSVRYGGVRALDGVSIEALPGRVTGLIGPNGAGKTTLFNACCGLVKIEGGSIALHGQDITNQSSAARAQLGLGRTFQRPDILPSLKVAENIAIGLEANIAGARAMKQIFSSRKEKVRIERAVEAAARMVGIVDLLEYKAGDLPAGQQRLVELARVVGGPFDMVLLDEPSAGLSSGEVDAAVDIFKRMVRELGLGLLLVEHDMSMVRNVCDYLYVLDFGRLIFEGTVAEMLESDVVKTAYLGVGVRSAGANADAALGSAAGE